MFRAILLALTVFLALHALAGAGFVGWLWGTERLSRDRVERVVSMFEPTLAEEEAAAASVEEEIERRVAERLEAEHQARAGRDPVSLEDRLGREQEREELALHRRERLEREQADLQRQVERAQRVLREERESLREEREALERWAREQEERRTSEDFQQTVAMYEQLRPGQAKNMFQRLLAEGEQEQVVEYLAAMQLRRAGRVLSAFDEDDPEELEQVTDLLESLRRRGVNPLGNGALARDD